MPEIPKVLSRLGWSRKVNAKMCSSKIRNETCLSSAFLRRPPTTLITAVSVPSFSLRADCFQADRFLRGVSAVWVKTIFSRIFEVKGKFGTGRKSFKSLGSSPGFFNSGVTAACLNLRGTVPEQKNR